MTSNNIALENRLHQKWYACTETTKPYHLSSKKSEMAIQVMKRVYFYMKCPKSSLNVLPVK